MNSTSASRPLLWPLVPIYNLGLALRELQLRSGIKPIRRLRWPVVSVGNLSTGGAGKTPLTIALAKALTVRGVQVDVLSRGYGRSSTLPILVDPAGKSEDFGDEPLLIAREAGVPVYVAAERYEAGLLAERSVRGQLEASQDADDNPRLQAHILDDGFQHRQLARDVDILLLSRRDLADHLLPAGNLREPLHAAQRAHIIAIPADEPDLEAEIKKRGWKAQVWRINRRMEIPKLDGPVAAFCGIARPDQFFHGLESSGVKLASKTTFHDHHIYTAADLSRLACAARNVGAAALVTTEKDRVRLGALASTLPASLPLQTAQLRIEIEDEPAAIDWLIECFKLAQPCGTA